jgi:hypothetical protein
MRAKFADADYLAAAQTIVVEDGLGAATVASNSKSVSGHQRACFIIGLDRVTFCYRPFVAFEIDTARRQRVSKRQPRSGPYATSSMIGLLAGPSANEHAPLQHDRCWSG